MAVRAWSASAITSWHDTDSFEAAEQISEMSQCIIQGSMGSPGSFDESTEGHMEKIRQLGHGGMTQEDATEFISAFKLLWPSPEKKALVDVLLIPEAIMKLDAEIHEGGLARVVPTAPIILDLAYKSFVYAYCR
ncbi:hypothetical protein ACHAPU_006670 [Fusarium lateritium]